MSDNQQKQMTINDLAAKMDAGFAHVNKNLTLVNENHESLARMVAKGFENTAKDISELKTELKQDILELKQEVSAVKSNVNNYLELSEKRYVELKQRDAMLAKWIKLVAEKTGVPVDVSQLEII